MKETNIVLVGMPGAGKSTIGVILAKATGKTFIDTDLIIQQRYNRLLQDIINDEGINNFLSKEESIVTALDVKNHVIATGGSVIYSNQAMDHLKRDSLI
ncbi:MAG: shikimate kinase, partial [Clostridiaceae bacterium]|nr:shikimate kinase [Clostridiaceae bacterium]